MIRSTPPTRLRARGPNAVAWGSVALLVALGLGGCQAMSAISYLALNREMPNGYPSDFPAMSVFPGMSGFPVMSDFPDASDPCLSAQPSFTSFSHGSATLDLVMGSSTQHLVLDRVDGAYTPGDSPCGPGTGAAFTTLNGVWMVEVDGSPALGGSAPANILVSYDNQGTSFLAGTGEGCRATVTQADAKGIVGTATCTNAHWMGDNDQTPAPSSSFGGSFSATVTFEARP